MSYSNRWNRDMIDSQPKKRGQKLCAHCNTVNGVRSYECKNCGQAFKMKKVQKGVRKKKVLDFKDLKKGDRIKVIQGSGSYHVDYNGERTYLQEGGKYTVVKTDDLGIHAYGKTGYNYLYMGERCASPTLDSITRSPCKIVMLVGGRK